MHAKRLHLLRPNDITVSQKAQPLYISVTDGYP